MKTTNNIAQRASLGTSALYQSLAEGEQQNRRYLLDAFSVRLLYLLLPSDARWAILLVAVGDEYLDAQTLSNELRILLIHGNDILWGLLIWVFVIIPALIAGGIYLLYKIAKWIRFHIDSKNKDEAQN